MKRTALALAAVMFAAAFPALAGDGSWSVLPIQSRSYQADPTVALKLGAVDPAHLPGGFAGGIEVAVDDPLLSPPVGRIRDQFSYTVADHGGVMLQMLEVNPHYLYPLGSNWWVGGGPGVGYVIASPDRGSSADLWAVQAGGQIQYWSGGLMVGLESRYQWTEDATIGTGTASGGADNWLTTLKLGVRF
ncbi:MAG: hypothetical protein ACM31L_13655 [Actinomycetota bacterium]